MEIEATEKIMKSISEHSDQCKETSLNVEQKASGKLGAEEAEQELVVEEIVDKKQRPMH